VQNTESSDVTFWGLAGALGAVTCAATLASLASAAGWPIELASHFRVQYLLTLIVLALLFVLRKRTRTAVVLALFAIPNAAAIAPAFFGARIENKPSADLRLMLANVYTGNTEHERVLAAIRDLKPDVIVLLEVNDRWLGALKPALSPEYSAAAHEAREDNFGIALFSRRSLVDAKVVSLGAADVPSVVARLEIDGRPLSILGTHTLPPGSRRYTELRDDQLAAIPAFLRQTAAPWVVLGDLNTTPWSDAFQDLLEVGGLKDSMQGFGIQATWPSFFWPLLIPIDHCLHTPGITVVNRFVGPPIGSDHYPLVIDLALPQARQANQSDAAASRRVVVLREPRWN
jgi:endonuclease/exonuclease/phosphatase (EEP) superfamily protein YafD